MTTRLLLTCALLGGCTPLQQAPLVYTSKQVLGVDFSTPSAESPSVALNIGFKSLDAAYIPVAVARKTDAGELIQVLATHGQGASKTAQNNEDSLLKQQALDNLKKAIEEKNAAEAKLAAFQSKAEDYDAKAQQNDKNLVELKTSLSTIINDNQLPKALLNNLKADQPLDKTKVADAKANLEQEVSQANTKAATAKEVYAQVFDDLKKDSLSVFGTFDSSFGHQDASGVSQRLGKVFATGVAAQNLTNALHTKSAIEQCTELLKLASDTQKQQVLDLCSKQSSATVQTQ